MEQKQAERIQTSILNGLEHKLLVWLAQRQPRWVTSDMLTIVGSIGAVIIAIGYILTTRDIRWLWLASFGFLVNWYGDSLDGNLARVRNTQRPIYGFYLDHTIDGFNETLMFLGVGFSCLVNLSVALVILAEYLLLSTSVYINSHLKGEFRLTYAKMGPTEFRLIAIIINTICIYTPAMWTEHQHVWLGIPCTVTAMDYCAIAIIVVLAIILAVTTIQDIRYYSKIDPKKHFDKQK